MNFKRYFSNPFDLNPKSLKNNHIKNIKKEKPKGLPSYPNDLRIQKIAPHP